MVIENRGIFSTGFFFIAGAIAAFVSQASVLKYFGAQSDKLLSCFAA